MRAIIRVCLLATCTPFSPTANAQTPTTVRPIGRLLAASEENLASVSQVRALSGGRVIVHDNAGRRVLLFDSTLQHATVIADTTDATRNAYGARLGGLIAYRGDTTLLVDPTAVSMLVIDPSGHIVKTIAAPAGAGSNLIGGPFGTPGFDSKGRLVFRSPLRMSVDPSTGIRPSADSALIVRFDFAKRSLDTVVKLAIPVVRFTTTTLKINGQFRNVVDLVVDPIPWTDDWAVLSDGTIAVVRGRDYRVDFIDGDGRVTFAPRVPFAWQRLTDEDKSVILDSVKADMQKERQASSKRDSVARANAGRPGPLVSFPLLQFVALNEMPDYRPAFRQGAARGDADGHLWIRTSKSSNGGVVYDVVDRRGVLIDRVQVPPGRSIAGFGPGGVIYMGVLDNRGVARLERALIH